MQYADDTMLLLEDDLTQAKNLKLVLYVLEKIFGLKTNYHKSELYCLGKAGNRV